MTERRALAASRRALYRAIDHRLHRRPITAVAASLNARVLERRESGRSRDQTHLVAQRGGGGEGPGMHVEGGEVVQGVRQQRERAGVAATRTP